VLRWCNERLAAELSKCYLETIYTLFSFKETIMKSSVAIVLIIMGALVIITPPVSNYLHGREVAKLLAQEGPKSVSLEGGVSETYSFGCWAAGLLMIGLAVLGSTQRKPSSKNTNADN